MTPDANERQALHRENQRISGHLNGLAALKARRATASAETVPPTATPTPTITAPPPRPVARIQAVPPPAPEPTASQGFFDDFESDTRLKPHTDADGTFSLDDDSTAIAPMKMPATSDTGRMSASAEETSDELRRPAAAAPQGEAINDILDGFNW